MKRSKEQLFGLILSVILLMSCNFSSILSTPPSPPIKTPTSISITTIAGTPALAITTASPVTAPAVPSPAVTATSSPIPDPNIRNHRFANMSIDIPVKLVETVDFKVVAEAPPYHNQPWVVAPAYVLGTLVDYPGPPDSFLKPEIRVYPAPEYAQSNQGARTSLKRLKTIQTNPSLPLTNDLLPWLPFTPGEQSFGAQAKILDFGSGSGVRFVTQYDIFLDPKVTAPGEPIVNRLLFYTYQGLSSDGKYLVIAILPVSIPILSNDPNPTMTVPPGGIPYPGLGLDTSHSQYFRSVTEALNAASADFFSPSLQVLDAMIGTLQVGL